MASTASPVDTARLANKIAILTGSGSSIGRAIALRFAAEGTSVMIAELDEARGSETLRAIEQAGGHVQLIRVDVANERDAERMAAATVDHFGRIDILVNNAAIGGGDDILATDEATWDRILAVVLKSVLLCCRATLPSQSTRAGVRS
jgi:NAD(P)-dependent dehydrogenase (short-subunit alcohol dehydrogenase family)